MKQTLERANRGACLGPDDSVRRTGVMAERGEKRLHVANIE
jgi:hypothetical protein